MIKLIAYQKIGSMILCSLIFLCLCACQNPTYYPPNEDYTLEEVQQLFFDNQEAFAEVAQILLDNDDAYKNREPESESRLFLWGSAERYKRYYSEQEYETLDAFFQTFRPYAVERGYDYVYFTFYCTISNEVKGVSVLYFDEYTAYAMYSQYGLVDLGGDWYFLNRNH